MLEGFDYDYNSKIAYFGYSVFKKSPETSEDAVRNLLIGLARITAKAKFGHFIPKNEMEEYLLFVDLWFQKCIKAIQ
jgi:hypothetical protein